MTDPLAGQPAVTEASAPQVPALTLADIEAVVRKSQEEADKRVAGVQSALGKQIQALADENKRLKRTFAGDDDEMPDPRVAELEAELARVQREAEMERARREFPDVFDAFAELESRQSTTDRLAYLRELQTRLTASQNAAEEPAPEPETPTPPVHPNQPAREPKGWIPGTPMDPRTAEEFFKNLDAWPGYPR